MRHWLLALALSVAAQDESVSNDVSTAPPQTQQVQADNCRTVPGHPCLIADIHGSSKDICTPECEMYFNTLGYQCCKDYEIHNKWIAMKQACDPGNAKKCNPPPEMLDPNEDPNRGNTLEDVDSWVGAAGLLAAALLCAS